MLGCRTASIQLNHPRETVFNALSDYASYQKWMPGVLFSQVLAQEGDIIVAEFVWPLLLEEKVVLEFIHLPPESVIYHQVGQDRRRGLSGRWDLSPAPDGLGTVLAGTIRLRTGLRRAWSNGKKVRSALAQSLEAIARRVLGEGTPNRPEEVVARKKILEVVKRPGGLEVWFAGDVYWLEKRPGKASGD
jgi:hypothetical protein